MPNLGFTCVRYNFEKIYVRMPYESWKIMGIKGKIKGIIHASSFVLLAFGLVFLIFWTACFFYSAVQLVVQNINYQGHATGEVIRIEEWMGWNEDAEAYNFHVISYRYQTENGEIVTGKEDTNSRETNSADRFVKEIPELNPDIRVGARQVLRYDIRNPARVISEYYRKNQEIFCLFTGLSSAAAFIIIFLIFRARRQHQK